MAAERWATATQPDRAARAIATNSMWVTECGSKVVGLVEARIESLSDSQPDYRIRQHFPWKSGSHSPKTRVMEETRGLAASRGGVLDHARPRQLLSAHRSDLDRRGCLEAAA